MPLSLDENSAKYQIRKYKPGFIQVNETIYKNSIIITSDYLTNWNPKTCSELKKEDLDIIRELKPTILLLGTGKQLQFPKLELYGDLINFRIGVEVMDTKTACFTFSALTAENRNVAAALIVE